MRAGAFIAGELGKESRPLLPEVVKLLGHRDGWVRSDTLTAVLLAATPEEGEEIAQAIALANHPDSAARRDIFEVLTWADRAQLAAAHEHLADRELAKCVGWLLSVEGTPSLDSEIEAALIDQERMSRWFAGVAAVRAYQRNPNLLSRAAESNDEELRRFAESELRMLEASAARKAAGAVRKARRRKASQPQSAGD